MKVRKHTEEADIKTMRLPEACKRYGLGENTMKKIAEDAHARIRVGKAYLINVTIMDAYMDSITE